MEKYIEAKQGELGPAWEGPRLPGPGGSMPLMGAGAGLEKAWRSADEGAGGPLENRGRQ